jgi:hypothetical protein
VAAVLAAYSLAEVGYRLLHHFMLQRADDLPASYRVATAPFVAFDPQRGSRYITDATVLLTRYDHNHFVESYRVHFNNMGHVSPTDDSVEKRRGEFRIAVIGDSFTANLINDSPWTFSLERRLGADQGLKEELGVQSFKVINGGMAGIGIVQFPAVYDSDIRRFAPDLLVLDFISDDVARRFTWRKMLEDNGESYAPSIVCTSLPATWSNRDCELGGFIWIKPGFRNDEQGRAQMLRKLNRQASERLDWFQLYPEALAVAAGGRIPGLPPRLTVRRTGLPRFSGPDDGVRESARALEDLRGAHPQVAVVHTPVEGELLGRAGVVPPVVARLLSEAPGLEIQLMSDYLGAKDPKEVARRFIPGDGHLSRYGSSVFADAMYRWLRDCLPHGSCAKRSGH